MAEGKTELIKVALISTTQSTQTRAEFSQEAIDEYSKILDKLPPIVLFWDGEQYHIGDGHHRYFAVDKAGLLKIPAHVYEGTERDALKYALQSNADHGLRRTNADKRNAVRICLEDEEWKAMSDRAIAELCHVHHETVAAVRKECEPDDSVADSTGEIATRTGKDGKQRPAKKKNAPKGKDSGGKDSGAGKPPAGKAKGTDADDDSDTDFDPGDLPKAEKSGKEKIAPEQRREARKAMGVVVRFLDLTDDTDAIAAANKLAELGVQHWGRR